VKAGILLFRPNAAQNSSKGLGFGVPVKTLKIYNMGIFSCISLKLGICGLYITYNFLWKKKFSPQFNFLASEVVKIEKSSYFVQKTAKT
jgi:hypothetical protein